MSVGKHAASITHQRSHARLNANFREKNSSESDLSKLEGAADEVEEGVHHKALRLAHGDFLKEMHSRTTELFMEYESQLMSVLQTAMNDSNSTGKASIKHELHKQKSTESDDAASPTSPAFAGLSTVEEGLNPSSGPSPPVLASEPTSDLTSPAPAANAAHAKPLAEGADPETADLKRERAGVLAIDAHQDILDNLDENVYRVENFYKKEGMPQAVARSEWFNHLTLLVITINAVYLGIDADHNTEDVLANAGWGWVIMENVFCIFFTIEIVIRFMAFAEKRNCLVDGWFRFDACLVLLMILEVWGMLLLAAAGAQLSGLPTGPLRLLRLLRLSRMVRLMRNMPELVTMIKGMRTASRAVASSCVMVILLVYVFSIVMMMMLEPVYQNLGPEDGPVYEHRLFIQESFEGLIYCMWTLLMDGSFMYDAGGVLIHLREADHEMSYFAILVFLAFMLLSALTVLNMLIGVLCEVVTAVGQAERDEADIRLVKQGILKELLKFDADGSGTISQTELEHVMKSKRAQRVLEDLEVDQASLENIHGMLFKNPTDQCSIKMILETCLNYRGSQPPTVKHLVDGMVFNRYYMSQMVKNEIHQLTRTMVRQNVALRQEFQKSGQLALPAPQQAHCTPEENVMSVPGRVVPNPGSEAMDLVLLTPGLTKLTPDGIYGV